MIEPMPPEEFVRKNWRILRDALDHYNATVAALKSEFKKVDDTLRESNFDNNVVPEVVDALDDKVMAGMKCVHDLAAALRYLYISEHEN